MILFGLLLAAAAVSVLQSWVFRRWGLRRVRYARTLSRFTCTEGDEVELIETIANEKWLPIPWIRLESLLSANLGFRRSYETDISGGQMFQHHKSLFSLPPYTQVVRRHAFECRKRGCYRLQTVTMTTGDPLGMVKTTKTIPTQSELLVYPKPEEPERTAALPSGWQGDTEVRRWIVDDPFVTEGVRDYRPGDPLNSVHWKATARTGSLQVHRYGQTSDSRLLVCVNFDVTPDMWKAVTDPELIERGIRHAAWFCEQALAEGMVVGFGCNGRSIDGDKFDSVRVPPSGGADQLTFLLETMAGLTIERTVGFDMFLEEERPEHGERTDYVIITTFVSDAAQDQINRLKRAGSTVTIIPLAHLEDRRDAYGTSA